MTTHGHGTGDTLLDEQGIKITPRQLITSGKAFAWGDLSTVRIAKHSNWLIRLITRKETAFHLMVSKKGDSMTTTVYSTQDAALTKRIEMAISAVAQRRGAIRECSPLGSQRKSALALPRRARF